MVKVSELEEMARRGMWIPEPRGRWCELPPEYHFCYPHCDTHLTFYEDGWGSDKNADGEYFDGHDMKNGIPAKPAEIFVRVKLRKDGRPNIANLAHSLMAEWEHHWLAIHEGAIAEITLDNVGHGAGL